MPIYEYRYVTNKGRVKHVDMMFGMSSRPDTIEVHDEEDGIVYTAHRVQISLTADMSSAWEYDTSASDLPPVDASPDVWKKNKKMN